MDQATQQNAALVEEMAAAASSLRGQAQTLVQSMDFFKIEQSRGVNPSVAKPKTVVSTPVSGATKTPAKVVATSKPVARASVAPLNPSTTVKKTSPAPVAKATTSNEDDWESF